MISRRHIPCEGLRWSWFLLPVLFLIPTMISPAAASHLTMVGDTTVTADADLIEVTVTITNRGDEDALVVYPSLRLMNDEIHLEQISYLERGKSHQWRHRFTEPVRFFDLPGTYPLILTIHYHDLNMYPFSILDVIPVRHGVEESRAAGLSGAVNAFRLKTDGEAGVTLANHVSRPLAVKLRLVLPEEVSAAQPVRSFELAAEQERKLLFKLRNQAALPGSSYRIFAVAEYTDEGRHYSRIFPGTLPVAGRAVDPAYRLQVIGGGIGIFVLFVMVAVKELGKADGRT